MAKLSNLRPELTGKGSAGWIDWETQMVRACAGKGKNDEKRRVTAA